MSDCRSSVVVAIPVKNEAERISNCLRALSAQRGYSGHQVVLLLNNCTDGSAAIAAALAKDLRIRVHLFEANLPSEKANAGQARRLATRVAEKFVSPRGVLLTTDADARVYPNWIEANLRALEQGADAVAGCAEIDPIEAALIPPKLHEDDAREGKYGALLDELDARIDPDPADPWPHHSEHSGASIAVTVDAYRSVGGIPAVPLGEDRAFFDALRRIDCRIRHTSEPRVVVSGRILGRAVGGMADTICRRMSKADEWLDSRLEPARNATWRACLRALVRSAWPARSELARLIPVLEHASAMSGEQILKSFSLPHFGAAWAMIEKRSTSLAKRRVPVKDLERETEHAREILQAYSLSGLESALFVSAGRGGISARVCAASSATQVCTLPYSARLLHLLGRGNWSARSSGRAELLHLPLN